MQHIQHRIHIDAPREIVWHAMLDDVTYRAWTKPFNPTSRYEGEWHEGSKMRFIGIDPDTGKESGMVSRIAQCRPHEFVSIEHLGTINEDGNEDTTSEEAKKWAPAFENYTFTEKDGGTELTIDLDTPDEYVAMFDTMWPESLTLLKNIAEGTER